MGASIGYFSVEPVAEQKHRELLSLASKANEAYHWWCESICISETPDETGSVFGFTKLFCLIGDEVTDTYMAFLDICEIVRFLTTASERLGVEWRLEIAGSHFGKITRSGPDDELQAKLASFLEEFPGDFESLRSRPRAEILAEWPDR
jgi:hypothetical protein